MKLLEALKGRKLLIFLIISFGITLYWGITTEVELGTTKERLTELQASNESLKERYELQSKLAAERQEELKVVDKEYDDILDTIRKKQEVNAEMVAKLKKQCSNIEQGNENENTEPLEIIYPDDDVDFTRRLLCDNGFAEEHLCNDSGRVSH